jgi:ElaB/YqjD/DUF883 family membrane-anchored ribosome-binding protein
MAERPSELEINNQTEWGSEVEARTETDNPMEFENPEVDSSIDEPTEETEKIREQIQETRQQMGETIDAIQEKLSFSNISEQVKEQVSEQISTAVETAKDAVYDATIRKAGNFMQTVTNNLKQSNIFNIVTEMPFPFILIGVGTGLLVYNRLQKKPGNGYRSRDYRANLPSTSEASMLKSAKDKVSGTLNSVSEAAGSTYETVTDAAQTAYQGVGNAVTGIYEKAGSLKSQSLEKFDYYIEENPLAVGAVAAALGATVALSIPSTSYENQLMGETNQNLIAKAEDAARGAFEKVQQVAGEVQKTIGDEIKS